MPRRPRSAFLHCVLLAVLALVPALPLAAFELPLGEPVELPLEPLQDETGRTWSFAQDGTLVSEDQDQGGLFESAARLVVDNRPFAPAAGQLLRLRGEADPWLMIPSAGAPDGLRVVRFVHLARATGVCRYVEVVANTGLAKRQVQVRVQNQFHWSPRSIDWQRHDAQAKAGAVVHFGSRRIPSLALWWGREPRMALQEGSNTATLEANLEIAPGEALGVVHAFAVRPSPDEAQRLIKTWSEESLGAGLPWLPELRLLNLRRGSTAIDAMRSPDIDSLLLVPGERVRGSVMTGDFSVRSEFGDTRVARAELAGLSRRPDGLFTLYGEDGTALAGELEPSVLAVALPTGDELSIPLAEVRVLALRSAPRAKQPAAAPTTGWWLVTTDQQRLLLAELTGPLTIATCLGDLSLPLADLAALDGYQQGPPVLTLASGSRLHLAPGATLITGRTRAGAVLSVPLMRVRTLRPVSPVVAAAAGAPAAPAAPASGSGPAVGVSVVATLVNGDSLRGALDGPLRLATTFREVLVQPAQVRALALDGSGQATVHFTDGSYLQGRLAGDPALVLSWGQRVLLPLAMLSGIAVGVENTARRQVEDQARAMLLDLANPDAERAQAAGAWLAAHRVQLREFLGQVYEAGELSEAVRRRLGLIIGKEF